MPTSAGKLWGFGSRRRGSGRGLGLRGAGLNCKVRVSRDRSWRPGPGLRAERWAQSDGPAGTGRGFEDGVSRKKLGGAPAEPWRVVGLGAELGVDLKRGGPGGAELEGRVGGVVRDQGRDLGGKAERGGCQVAPGALLYRLSRAFTEHHELEDSNLVDSLTCCQCPR